MRCQGWRVDWERKVSINVSRLKWSSLHFNAGFCIGKPSENSSIEDQVKGLQDRYDNLIERKIISCQSQEFLGDGEQIELPGIDGNNRQRACEFCETCGDRALL